MEVRMTMPPLPESVVWLMAGAAIAERIDAQTKEELATAGELADYVIELYKARGYKFDPQRSQEASDAQDV